MPSCSKTWSPSRASSSASWYWNPEQPPPLTATRRPASACSCVDRNSVTFFVAISVRVTIWISILAAQAAAIFSVAMPSAEDLKTRIEQALPGSTAAVEDLTGGGDHFRAEIVSDRFDGLSRIEQHQLVYSIFGAEIGGPIHALSLKTSTPGDRS